MNVGVILSPCFFFVFCVLEVSSLDCALVAGFLDVGGAGVAAWKISNPGAVAVSIV